MCWGILLDAWKIYLSSFNSDTFPLVCVCVRGFNVTDKRSRSKKSIKGGKFKQNNRRFFLFHHKYIFPQGDFLVLVWNSNSQVRHRRFRAVHKGHLCLFILQCSCSVPNCLSGTKPVFVRPSVSQRGQWAESPALHNPDFTVETNFQTHERRSNTELISGGQSGPVPSTVETGHPEKERAPPPRQEFFRAEPEASRAGLKSRCGAGGSQLR